MNTKIRNFEKQSGLEVYGLGLDRTKWESTVENFARLIIEECATIAEQASGYRLPASSYGDLIRKFERLKESDYTIQLGD